MHNVVQRNLLQIGDAVRVPAGTKRGGARSLQRVQRGGADPRGGGGMAVVN